MKNKTNIQKDFIINYMEIIDEYRREKEIILSACNEDNARTTFNKIFKNRHSDEDYRYDIINIKLVDTTEYKTFLAEFYNIDDEGEVNFKDFAVVKVLNEDHAKQLIKNFEEDMISSVDFINVQEVTHSPFIARAYLDV